MFLVLLRSFSFVPSRVWCQLFFLCSPLVPFLWSFSLASCHYIFFGFLLLSRSPSSIDPSQSFFLVPLPSSFFSLISVPRSVHCSLRFSSVSCHAMYIKNICIPASFPFRSGRVPVPFPFRFLFVLAAFWSRLQFVSFSFRPRSGPVFFSFRWRLLSSPFSSGGVPVPSPFRFLLVPAAFRPRCGGVSFSFPFRPGRVSFSFRPRFLFLSVLFRRRFPLVPTWFLLFPFCSTKRNGNDRGTRQKQNHRGGRIKLFFLCGKQVRQANKQGVILEVELETSKQIVSSLDLEQRGVFIWKCGRTHIQVSTRVELCGGVI